MNNDFNMGKISEYRTELMGLSMILVMVCHFVVIFSDCPDILQKIFARGNIGVDIFLLLSGLGLYYSLQKNDNYFNFIKRRFSKILISYIIVAIPLWIMKGILLKESVSVVVSNIFLISFWNGEHNTTLWYIALIIPLYIVSPIIFYLISNRRRKLISKYFLIIVAGLINILMLLFFEKYYSMVEIAISRIVIFVIGLCFANYVYDNKTVNIKYIQRFLLVAPVIEIICLCIPCSISLHKLLERWSGGIFALWIIIVAIYVIDKMNLRFRFFMFLGKFTLEIYIVHAMFVAIVSRYWLSSNWHWESLKSFILYAVFLTINVVIAYAFYFIKIKFIINNK